MGKGGELRGRKGLDIGMGGRKRNPLCLTKLTTPASFVNMNGGRLGCAVNIKDISRRWIDIYSRFPAPTSFPS